MSRAFKRESDAEHQFDPIVEPREVLPSGVKNYITPRGAALFLERLRELNQQREPLLVSIQQAREAEAKRQLRVLDQRISQLQKRFDSFEIVDPGRQRSDRVLFGATVTVSDQSGQQRTYQICGVDETDPDQGRISWISPIARALLSKEVGDEVRLRLPRGERSLEIVAIEFG